MADSDLEKTEPASPRRLEQRIGGAVSQGLTFGRDEAFDTMALRGPARLFRPVGGRSRPRHA